MKKIMLLAAALGVLTSAHSASAKPATPAPPAATLNVPISASEEVRLKQFLDKDGGYRDKLGGTYNPKAGTYTDADGGVVDNWSGYTYKNGSYKAKTGDYWDAPARTMHLATGDVVKVKDASSADVIKVLRNGVEQVGGYDKDFTRKSMLQAIEHEHPPG